VIVLPPRPSSRCYPLPRVFYKDRSAVLIPRRHSLLLQVVYLLPACLLVHKSSFLEPIQAPETVSLFQISMIVRLLFVLHELSICSQGLLEAHKF